jgi:hypothetical protein
MHRPVARGVEQLADPVRVQAGPDAAKEVDRLVVAWFANRLPDQTI